MSTTCEIRNWEKQSTCDKNECMASPVCNSVCSKPLVCRKEYSPVRKHCHQSCDKPRRHHSHETFYNASDCCNSGSNTRQIVISVTPFNNTEDEGTCGRREPYYNTNYGCGRSVSRERGPVTRIILSGNSGENNRAACGPSLGTCNNGESNANEVIIVDKERSRRKDKCDFQLIKEDFTTKTCSTKAHRVYEKNLPKKQNTVEIVIKQDQPNTECAAPAACNPVCPQPRVQPCSQPPCCPNQECCPPLTMCHHHHHYHHKSRRSRSCDNFYSDCDDRCYRYRSGRRLRPNGRIYVNIDDEVDRGCCRNTCEERRPISKVILIRGEENNKGCGRAHTARKCCCTKSCNPPVICEETKPQCCQCQQPCPNYNTCHCVVVPIQMEKRRLSCCHCIKKLLGRKKSPTCCPT